jgi:hypothetical protein
MPCLRARSSPTASGFDEITAVNSTSSLPASRSATRRSKVVPRPDSSTATRKVTRAGYQV